MKALVVIFGLSLVGCFQVKGGTEHTVGGEATVKVVVGVDVTVCEALDPEAKVECIKALIEIAKQVTEKKDDSDEQTFPGMY